jgi:hypothetical protein
VEEEAERAPPPPLPDPRDELRVVPLVHDHEVDPFERGAEIEPLPVVEHAAQLREALRERAHGGRTVLLNELRAAPAVARLVHRHRVPSAL